VIALATTAIAWIIGLILAIGWLVYAMFNARSARRELGSEIELAPNRRPYYSDEELEGKRLELVQFVGVLLLIVIVIGLPLYWVFEPSRQAGARVAAEDFLIGKGAGLFDTTANHGFNCAGCHGGMNATGGSAPFSITDPTTGEVRSVSWRAPALNTVLYRFTPEEVQYIITYGRPGTPMSAWGLAGGGPLNAQQILSLISYLTSIQVPREDCDASEAQDPHCPTGHLPAEMQQQIEQSARQAVEDGTYESYGEALFNLELSSGAFSCARCHTSGWSYGEPQESGQGGLGPNLTGGSTDAHFPDVVEQEDFVSNGSENGVGYGEQGQGSGKMPGFGQLLTEDQIAAIVEYERSL
jgi:mono/diheme cytochrome c family protein